MKKMFVNTDGGSRGNPGPAAIGVVFFDQNNSEIYHYKEYIGEATNNEAEYKAIIKALEILAKSKWFLENNGNDGELICRLDSQLVVEQINGNYKVKQEHIKKFIERIKEILGQYHLSLKFIHVKREENKIADKLVNQALDEVLKPKR